jgi:glutamate synthase (NADPH/NADH) small chain
MPAQKDQIEEAKEEGVEFKLLTSPMAFRGSGGRVAVARMQVMKLGPPDASGRRRPEPTDSEFDLSCTSVIQAVGRRPNSYLQRLYGMKMGEKDAIAVDERYQTSIPGVFAGGDVTTGETSVGMAMANGRKAAQYIHEYLMKLEGKHVSLYDMYYTERTKPRHYWDMLLGKEEKLPPP